MGPASCEETARRQEAGPAGQGRAHRGAASARLRRIGVLAVVPAALALAACGSSSSSSTTTSSTTSSSTSSSSPPVVKTANNSKYGTILVDSSGKTLYTFTSGGHAATCSASCISLWPPLMLPAGQTSATGGPGVSGLGVATVSGAKQVTVNGLPLYTYLGDPAAGDANGNGIHSFGGLWQVAKPGVSGASSSGSGATSTTASSGGGYGY